MAQRPRPTSAPTLREMMQMTDRHETVLTSLATDLRNELSPGTRTTLLRIAEQQRAMLVRYSLRPPLPE